MAKDYWSVKLSSNECRSKVPYSGYVSCQHWENKKRSAMDLLLYAVRKNVQF